MDNNVNKTEVIDEAEVVREYAEEYMPKVHRIGWSSADIWPQ